MHGDKPVLLAMLVRDVVGMIGNLCGDTDARLMVVVSRLSKC